MEPDIESLLETALQDAYNKGYAAGTADARAMIHRKLRSTTGESPILNQPIEVLELSERPRNCLRRNWTLLTARNGTPSREMLVSDLIKMSETDLLAITNFGLKAADEVKEKLAVHGLRLKTVVHSK